MAPPSAQNNHGSFWGPAQGWRKRRRKLARRVSRGRRGQTTVRRYGHCPPARVTGRRRSRTPGNRAATRTRHSAPGPAPERGRHTGGGCQAAGTGSAGHGLVPGRRGTLGGGLKLRKLDPPPPGNTGPLCGDRQLRGSSPGAGGPAPRTTARTARGLPPGAAAPSTVLSGLCLGEPQGPGRDLGSPLTPAARFPACSWHRRAAGWAWGASPPPLGTPPRFCWSVRRRPGGGARGTAAGDTAASRTPKRTRAVTAAAPLPGVRPRKGTKLETCVRALEAASLVIAQARRPSLTSALRPATPSLSFGAAGGDCQGRGQARGARGPGTGGTPGLGAASRGDVVRGMVCRPPD